MARPTSTGTCTLCEQTYSRAGMGRHLKACRRKVGLQRVVSGEEPVRIGHSRRAARSYHIAVEDRYDPRYWMHLQLPMNLDLRGLDQFLRNIWLECCEHLSAFYISGVTYRSGGIDLLRAVWRPPPRDHAMRRPAGSSSGTEVHVRVRLRYDHGAGAQGGVGAGGQAREGHPAAGDQ